MNYDGTLRRLHRLTLSIQPAFSGGQIDLRAQEKCGAFAAVRILSMRINNVGRLNSHDVDLLIFRLRL